MEVNFKSPNTDQRGLTFVELLITVLIISLLWVYMVRIYQGRIYEAKKAACVANWRVVQGQLDIYAIKLGRYPLNQKEFKQFLKNEDIFVEEPRCPFEVPYTLDVKKKRVVKHTH